MKALLDNIGSVLLNIRLSGPAVGNGAEAVLYCRDKDEEKEDENPKEEEDLKDEGSRDEDEDRDEEEAEAKDASAGEVVPYRDDVIMSPSP